MSEPQQNQDEALREFESAANKTAIERQHAMEAEDRTCLGLRIEIEQWKQRAEKAELNNKSWALVDKQREREIIKLIERAEKAEVELANRFPNIGPDPLKLDGDEWRKRGDMSKVREVLNAALSVQQSGVPDQTALVWRIDLSRLMDDHTVLTARWRDLKPALQKAEAACAELRNALEGCNEMFDTYGHTSESPCVRDKEIVANMLHALSSDCGRGYIPASELDKTINVLNKALDFMHAVGQDNDDAASVSTEIARLESLRKGAE